MTKHEIYRKSLLHPFQEFYLQIEPMENAPDDGKTWYNLILCCKGYGYRMDICGMSIDNLSEEIDGLLEYAKDHIGLWIDEVTALESYHLEN